MDTLMMVVCNPVAGQDHAFNAWYSLVHIRDVMRILRGSAVQRFHRSPFQPTLGAQWLASDWRYLTLYEIADKAACTAAHRQHLLTDEMPVSSTFDFHAFNLSYYDPLVAGDSLAGPDESGAVLIAGFHRTAAPGEAEAIAGRLATLPGIATARAFAFGDVQMMDLPVPPQLLILCRLADPALAAMGWDTLLDSAQHEPATPFAADRCHASIFLPLTARLKTENVELSQEAAIPPLRRARAALGDARHPANVSW